MEICYVIGAMPISRMPLTPGPRDMVIAADGGYANCVRLGLKPDLTVGDFDSLGYVPEERSVVAPAEKDDTDMALAVRLGIRRGASRFVLLGGTGGRPDHTLANYALLANLSQTGKRGLLLGDGWGAAAVTNGELEFPAACRGVVSVFSMDTASRGVFLEGLQYPLQDTVLYSAVALGVSNAFLGEKSRIAVREGTLLVLMEKASALQSVHFILR